jgi:signal transduction histidine kinase
MSQSVRDRHGSLGWRMIAVMTTICAVGAGAALPACRATRPPPTSARSDDQPSPTRPVRRVLVLHSYHLGFTWTDNTIRGIRESFTRSGLNIEAYHEFLDTKRKAISAASFARYADLLAAEYAPIRLDAILACDNDALNFLRTRRDTLFPGVPLVFTGINDFDARMLDGRKDVTGVSEAADYLSNVNAAFRMRPAATGLVVITDNTTTGRAQQQAMERVRSQMPAGLSIRYLSLGDTTLEDLGLQVSALGEDSMALLFNCAIDRLGRSYSVEYTTEYLTSRSSVPVLVVTDGRLGLGPIGGLVTSGHAQGMAAADIAVAILTGTPVGAIPVVLKSPNRWVFDYRAMKRFGIGRADLPAASTILNQPPSILDQHLPTVIVAGVVFVVVAGSLIVVSLEVFRRKRAEADRDALEGQLRQSAKMEAVGRLAGGVAHDFNNLLTVIDGNVELALEEAGTPAPVREYLDEVRKASGSAASVTRQLLAFSRRQIIEPRVLNLNALITTLHRMLVRLISEDVELAMTLADDLGAARVDPGQFEQVLVNLAVNARDAMPRGGRLTIETRNVALDAGRCARHPGIAPGPYVQLVVSDTGVGMTTEVRERLFEPFFTTKPKEHGTGLGLATVFGIVEQAGGCIDVSSEPGRGTTFEVCLPRVEELVDEVTDAHSFGVAARGSGTLLFVEDEAGVRELACAFLSRIGYTVLKAGSGPEALRLAAEHRGALDVLMTDVVMPEMDGRELATRLVKLHPETVVIYASGYTEDVIVRHGVLEANLNFIGKPYSLRSLAAKLKDVLAKRRS